MKPSHSLSWCVPPLCDFSQQGDKRQLDSLTLSTHLSKTMRSHHPVIRTARSGAVCGRPNKSCPTLSCGDFINVDPLAVYIKMAQNSTESYNGSWTDRTL